MGRRLGELGTEKTLLALRLHEGTDDEPARILAARDGDADARTWIVDRWTPPVWRFCRRMLLNDEDAGCWCIRPLFHDAGERFARA